VPQVPLTKGLSPPDPRPLSSTEFVEPLPEKILGYATDISNIHLKCLHRLHNLRILVVINSFVIIVLTNCVPNFYAFYIMIIVSEHFAFNMRSSLWFGCVSYSNDMCFLKTSIPLCSITHTNI